MKINFSEIIIKDIENNPVTLDLRHPLGNLMYMQGQSIEECETGREIYYSDGPVEVSEAMLPAIQRFADTYPYVTREAVRELLSAKA